MRSRVIIHTILSIFTLTIYSFAASKDTSGVSNPAVIQSPQKDTIRTPSKNGKDSILNSSSSINSTSQTTLQPQSLLTSGNTYAEGGALSVLNNTGTGNVSLLTGAANYNIELAGISCKSGFNVGIQLKYSSLIVDSLAVNFNEIAPIGWVGMGWKLGATSFIRVVHKNTVTRTDDTVYFHHSTGAESQIVNISGTYYVKSNPFWRVIPHNIYNTTGGDSITDGWTVTKEDGSIFKYGDFGGTPNAGRYVRCYGNTIGINPPVVYPTAIQFYYQWDISFASDVNSDSITYLYLPVIRAINGLSYIGESYPYRIKTNIGDYIMFDITRKNPAEGPSSVPSSDYNIFEYSFLNDMRIINWNGRLIDSLYFSYSALNSGVNGKEKRLLAGITSTKGTGALNHIFQYQTSSSATEFGCLVKVTNPKIGKRITYTWNKLWCNPSSPQVWDPCVMSIIVSGDVGGINDSLITNYRYNGGLGGGRFEVYDFSNSIGYNKNVWQYTGYDSNSFPNEWPFGVGMQFVGSANSTCFTFDMNTSSQTFGLLKEIDIYNKAGTKISSKNYDYESNCFYVPVDSNHWSCAWENSYLKNTYSLLDRVKDTIGNFSYFYNGVSPRFTFAINSDGTRVIAWNKFAYMDYPGMDSSGANMLTSISQKRIWKPQFFNPINDVDPGIDTVLKGTGTTWSNISGVWRPAANYIWNVDLNANGIPTIPFVAFNPLNPTSNNWQLTGAFDRYDNDGHLLQSSNALGVSNCSIYGTQAALPIASIGNATFFESGAFTCDYDLNETGSPFNYFDKQNGWEKDAGTIVTGMPHYGQKCLKILNGQGVMRNFKVRPNQGYELIGWVNVATGSQPLQVWVEYRTGPNPVTTWPIQWNQLTTLLSSFSTNISPTSGNWQRVDIRIPPRSETNLWIRIHFGLSGQSVTAYADDIRFGPANCQIATTYYDTLWRQPILSVDANSLPGRLVKYDQYGRPFRWYKIDGTKTRNFPLYDKLVQRKTYHLYGD